MRDEKMTAQDRKIGLSYDITKVWTGLMKVINKKMMVRGGIIATKMNKNVMGSKKITANCKRILISGSPFKEKER